MLRRAQSRLVRVARARLLALRILVFVLAASLSSSGALPVWAGLAGVEGPHVCHCSLDHHDCVCPRCGTDARDAEHSMATSLEGRCGDDEIAFGGVAMRAVLDAPRGSILAATSTELEAPLVTPRWGRDRSSPPTPPPRAT